VMERGTFDLTRDLAVPLPVTVIAELLGVEPERREDFKRWSDAFIGTGSGDDDASYHAHNDRMMEEFSAYFGGMVEARRRERRDDLISALVAAQEDRSVLSTQDILWFCLLLLVAGNETTTNLLGNLVAALIDAPDQWQALRADPTIAPSAIEETLRFDSPIQGFYRTALDDVYIGGVTIPADARVLLLFGAANRDESHYPDASRFDVTRNPVDHLAFGNGIHHCLGAQLARLEGRIVLEELIRRVESVEAAGEGERTGNPTVRGYRRLPVRFQSA
jgi:cytochrome P450